MDLGLKNKKALVFGSSSGIGPAVAESLIAEGVEAEAQRDFLLERGCRFFQGYLFGRPEPVREAF